MASKLERTVKVSEREFSCITCGLKVKEKELSLQCEICECWSHAHCEKISEEVMQVLQRENFHRYCMKYTSGVGKMLNVVMKMQERMDVLLKLVTEMCQKKIENLMFVGDFNLPGTDWNNLCSNNNTQYEVEFINMLREFYLLQHLTCPTRARGSDTPHTLDLVITNRLSRK